MKKLAILFLSILFVPAMLFAQYNVSVSTDGATDLKVEIPGYNDKVPSAEMNMRFEFDQASEILTVTCGSANFESTYDKIWLPQHEVAFSDLGEYMNNRGVKMIRSLTYIDQESFLDFSSQKLKASVEGVGMTFDGNYDIISPKKVKKQLDYQMVPLDGRMQLNLKFKVNPGASKVALKLHNPIPLDRSGRKATLGFVADDVVINIKLERCKDAEQLIQTIQEYEALFQVALDKLNDLKKSPNTQKTYRDFIKSELSVIDLSRFEDVACEEVQDSYMNLLEIIEEINKEKSTTPDYSSSDKPSCDTKKLDAEVKSVTSKLNNLVNDWSLAGSAAAKAEKKAAFDAEVKKFDAKLNGLPSGCKDKLDKKLLKNYEFVKKLVK